MFQDKKLKSRPSLFIDRLDYWLLVPVLLMALIGLIVLRQVLANGYGAGTYPGNFIKQMGAVIVGCIIALIIAYLDFPSLKLMAYVVYTISLLMLIWVKLDNFSLEAWTGADSWIRLPIIGSFQPSELSKIGIAMVGAEMLERIRHSEIGVLKGFGILGLVYGVPTFLIIREPDFGTSFVILVMLALTIFVWGISWKKIFAIVLVTFAVVLPFLWFFYFEDYQRNRILTIPFRGHDPALSFHTEQALKAISQGGLTGDRSGFDVYVPVKESDSIFVAISEYLGFFGTAAVIILSTIFFWRCFRLAMRLSEDNLAACYMVTALAGQMAFHFIENIGMNIGLLPITGIPLPFISDGGTSMVVNFIALGVILNISLNESYMGLSQGASL
ncbi:MAG: FtsW/RodA/SpoVE family cell cycle protein [Eubacteriales bacterium]|nr:FtsW/RodA/SpoVE family cell cycle protein [Eubacteriales bacterium]